MPPPLAAIVRRPRRAGRCRVRRRPAPLVLLLSATPTPATLRASGTHADAVCSERHRLGSSRRRGGGPALSSNAGAVPPLGVRVGSVCSPLVEPLAVARRGGGGRGPRHCTTQQPDIAAVATCEPTATTAPSFSFCV